MKKEIKKVEIIGTGSQAPYGIGEIIAVVPMSHWRRIRSITSRYYNAPIMRETICGNIMSYKYDYAGNCIGISETPLKIKKNALK